MRFFLLYRLKLGILVETKKEETLEILFEDPNPPGRLEQLLRKLLRGEEL